MEFQDGHVVNKRSQRPPVVLVGFNDGPEAFKTRVNIDAGKKLYMGH